MEDILEILKYTLPSLIVFLTVYYFLKKYFENESRKRTHQTLLKNQDVIRPLRLQAYERIVIYLERISHLSLVNRVNKRGYTCKQLQAELLNTIRIEWEHNLSQQIYITQKSWEVARNAKSSIIQLINISAGKVKEDSPSLNLSKVIFSSVMDKEKIYTAEAIKFIKEEMNSMFY